MNTLPAHPYLTHPHTGCPLQAVGILDSGRVIWPVLGASEGDAKESGETGEGNASAGDQGDVTFPANTPVAEMTLAQQVAYHKHQSRKHEERWKAYDGKTPDQVKEAFEKAKRQDELEHELSSEADKKAADARRAAESEKDQHYRPKLAETAFRIAIGNRKTTEEVAEFIADLNLSRFLTDDGDVDTAKVLARVEQFAPDKGNQQQQRKGPTVTGHGSGSGTGSASSLGNLSGSELYDRLHPKRTA